MPNEGNKILKYNHGEKSVKAPAIIYADLECLLEEMHSSQNNSEKCHMRNAEYAIQYIDMLKQIISIWKIMIKTLNHHT